MPSLLLVLLALIVALPLNAVQSVTASASAACTTGTVLKNTYKSKILRADMRYAIYLPPCYVQETRTYPTLYLMHGSNSDENHWLDLGIVEQLDQGISSGRLPAMIVVLPYGDWIANENRFDSLSWSNVFLSELMPHIEGRYRATGSKATRAIGGISRGGFWAFNIAWRYPELFNSVGGHSAFFSIDNAPWEYNPLFIVRQTDKEKLDTVRVWLDRGWNDYAYWGLDFLHKLMDERSIANQYTVYKTGEHNNDYWSSHVAEYLDFYAEGFRESETAASSKANYSRAQGEINTLFVPAVAFPSLQMNITSAQLNSVKAGAADPALVLDHPTAESLTALGYPPSPQTQIVEADQLQDTLWRGRDTLYTILGFDRLTPRLRMLHVDETVPLDFATDDPQAYPFAFHSDSPNYDPTKLTRFLLSGVTAITRGTMDAIDANGVEWAGEAIRPYTTRADFFHVSNEVSFHETCSGKARIEEKAVGEFCSKLYAFDLLRYVGVDIVELSGNHNLDFGVQPYLDTLKLYHDNGMLTVGGGVNLADAEKPLIVEHNGAKIGMIACNWAGPQWALAKADYPGAAWCDRTWLKAAVSDLKAQVDFVIVSVQYKETELVYPPDQQVLDFQMIADAGADVVIGSQAHLTQAFQFQPLQRGGEAFLHFGPGNLFFDQVYMQKRFFMDQLFIYDKKLLTVDLFVGITDEGGRPRPSEDQERTFFVRNVFRYSRF
ncbi:MAG: CapA family protein [Anaerolineae bacterium]|nr:CapA family protein [Anaerolineae bacterium]